MNWDATPPEDTVANIHKIVDAILKTPQGPSPIIVSNGMLALQIAVGLYKFEDFKWADDTTREAMWETVQQCTKRLREQKLKRKIASKINELAL